MNVQPENQQCENCGHQGLQPFIVRPEIFHVSLKCPQCSLFQKGIVAPDPMYEEPYHVEYSKRIESKTTTAKLRMATLKKHLPSDDVWLLDVGCSLGTTLRAAEQLGWNATGVDVSKFAVSSCLRAGLDAHVIDDYRLPFMDNSFDVITNWHVIEHVTDVRQVLQEWHRVLKPYGLMMLETPDADYLKARVMGTRYSKFWPSGHLYTFNKSNLTSLLQQSGFRMVRNRLTGGKTALPLHLNSYSVLYRGYRAFWRKLKLCKSVELTCRKEAA